MKIYIGNINIASLFDELRAGFEANGHEVFTAAIAKSTIQSCANLDFDLEEQIKERITFFDYKCPNAPTEERDKFISENREKLMHRALAKAVEADVCIFLVNSFLPAWQDIPVLKKNNVKVAIAFCGSEARVAPLDNLWRKITGSPPCNSTSWDMETTLHFIREAEYYADAILGATHAGLRPSYIPITTIYDVNTTPFHINTDRQIPVILHAPSRRETKGTVIWKEIFHDLKNEGLNFSVRFVENIPHAEFLKILKHVDIVCDGLIHGGKQAREGMAAGCATLSAFGSNSQACALLFQKDDDTLRLLHNVEKGSPEDRAIQSQHMKKAWWFYPEENPCIPVNPYTAKDKLRELLINREKRLHLARQGRDVLEKYCSPSIICKDILQCVNDPHSFETQTLLSFHRSLLYHDYAPKTYSEAKLLNKYTRRVLNCSWYKEIHKPQSRDGLIF